MQKDPLHQVRKRRTVISLFLLGICAAACGKADNKESDLSQFFVNSQRHDAAFDQSTRVARLPMGCAAFFVENDQNRTLVMSAKHCANYNYRAWCKTGSLTTADGETMTCKQVHISEDTRDISLLEFNRQEAIPAERTFSLAGYQPKVATKLLMIGYPADQYRHGALTVTENCWILKATVPSPYGGTLNDRSSLHNCTTYGGNSGGPMIQEDTHVVLGLPFTYAPNDYHLREADNLNTAAHMAQMAAFVEANKDTLQALGVKVVPTQDAAVSN